MEPWEIEELERMREITRDRPALQIPAPAPTPPESRPVEPSEAPRGVYIIQL
jgi:hypothetical protein